MNISFLNQNIYWIFFSAIVVLIIIGITANKFLPYFLQSSFYILGYYWLAALSYFIISIIIFNVILFLNDIMHFYEGLNNSPVFYDLFIASVIVITMILLIYGTLNGKKLKIKTYNIAIPKKETVLKELNMVMVSDIHISNINDKRQNKIINNINNLNPDIVFIVGDILDDVTPFVEHKMIDDFRNINSKYGVYACFGNHDYLSGDLSYITNRLNESKVNVLRDSVVEIANSFYVIGREDKSYEMISKQKREKLSNLIQGTNSKLPIIMLDHQPINISESKDAGVDLQLSGHTHRGQFFPFNLITDKLFKIHYGYLKTGKLQVIVSCGAGTWGPPIRIGSTSEVVNILVEFQD